MACPIFTARVAVVHSARKCPAPAAFRSFSNAARSRREVCFVRPDLLLRSPRTWREGRRTTPIAAAWGADVQFSECKVVSTSSVADKSVQLQAIAIDIGDLAEGYKKPGQFVQVKVEGSKPGFFAITSPPGGDNAVVELLIKNQPGSTAELLCNLDEGAAVDVSPVMGKGFAIETADPENVSEIVLFAQGTGISPIKALIESGLLQGGKRGSVSLYYGARSAEEMAFQDSFAQWEKLGVHVVPVYSADGKGYVQDAFKAAGSIKDPARTAVVLCGSKEMCEDVKTLFMGQGVPTERFLLNF